MFSYKFKKNQISDIEKLKRNLMERKASTTDANNSASISTRQAIKEKEGKLFEENIRKVLEYNYGFKKPKYPPTFFIKKIKNNKEEIEVLQNKETNVIIKEKNYSVFLMISMNFQ